MAPLSPNTATHQRLSPCRNSLVAELAPRVFIAHAAHGSKTEAFASKLAASGKPLITLDSPANGNLVELGLVVAKAGSDGMLLSRSTKRLTDRISIMKGDETFFLLFPMQVSRV